MQTIQMCSIYYSIHAKKHDLEHLRPPRDHKSICTAFTGEHRRCRLVQSEGTVCTIHKNYYRDWWRKHTPPLGLSQLTKRERAEFEFQLRGGYVKPTEEVVSTCPAFHYNQQLYKLYCSVGANPSWNKQLFKITLESMIHDILYQLMFAGIREATNIVTQVHDTCRGLFQTSVGTLNGLIILSSYTMSYLRPIWRLNPEHPPAQFRNMEKNMKRIWEAIATSETMLQIFKMPLYELFIEKTEKAAAATATDELKQYIYTNILEPAFRQQRCIVEERIKERCNLFKEELMATIWAPERMHIWMDVEFSEESKNSWNIMGISCREYQ